MSPKDSRGFSDDKSITVGVEELNAGCDSRDGPDFSTNGYELSLGNPAKDIPKPTDLNDSREHSPSLEGRGSRSNGSSPGVVTQSPGRVNELLQRFAGSYEDSRSSAGLDRGAGNGRAGYGGENGSLTSLVGSGLVAARRAIFSSPSARSTNPIQNLGGARNGGNVSLFTTTSTSQHFCLGGVSNDDSFRAVVNDDLPEVGGDDDLPEVGVDIYTNQTKQEITHASVKPDKLKEGFDYNFKNTTVAPTPNDNQKYTRIKNNGKKESSQICQLIINALNLAEVATTFSDNPSAEIKSKKIACYVLIAKLNEGLGATEAKRKQAEKLIDNFNKNDRSLNLSLTEAKKFSCEFQKYMKDKAEILTGNLKATKEVGMRLKRIPYEVLKIYLEQKRVSELAVAESSLTTNPVAGASSVPSSNPSATRTDKFLRDLKLYLTTVKC